MDIKEKLVELLREVQYLGGLEEKIADHLISHGVTAVRHGQWIYNIKSGEYVCSACGENALSFKIDTLYDEDLYETCLTDYCPNCGAKMDEEADT